MSEKVRQLDCVAKAKRIRKILRRRFPKTKFRVRSDRFSLGEAVDIHYTDGPATEKIQKIADMFDDVRRDSQTGEILSGGNSYVHVHRRYLEETWEKAKEYIKNKFVEGTFDEWDRDPHYRTRVFNYLYRTDF